MQTEGFHQGACAQQRSLTALARERPSSILRRGHQASWPTTPVKRPAGMPIKVRRRAIQHHAPYTQLRASHSTRIP